MKLSRAATEYVHVDITGAPFDAAPLEMSFDRGASWHPTVWNNEMTTISLLVAGPDSTALGDVVLSLGRHPVSVRLPDDPEVVVRNTHGVIEVA